MNDPLKIALVALSALAYAALILMTIIRYRRTVHLSQTDVVTGELESKGNESWIKRSRHNLRFDLCRLIMDCAVLLGFLLSDLYSAWFGLFREGNLGVCTGVFELITITLIVSILVDWLPVRESYRQTGKAPPSFASFSVKQLVSIFQIEFWLSIVWSVFLLLEPTRASVAIKIGASALVILLFRVLLRFARNSEERSDQ